MSSTATSGYSVVELLIATALVLGAAAAMFQFLDDRVAGSTVLNEAADLHQRARVAADSLSSVLNAAGAGSSAGVLPRFFPAVEPRRRLSGGASQLAITVRSVPVNAPRSTLASSLAPGAVVANIARHPGCPEGSPACGFSAGMDVAVFDAAGNWDTAFVESIAPDALAIADRPGPRSITYSAGAHVMQLVETTLYLEPFDGTLRREHPGVSNLPVLDNVVDLQFEYFGDPAPPSWPRPASGTANCLYDATGAPLPLPALAPDHGWLAELPIGMFDDGPMCGNGATAYDADLLRVRKIRVVLVLQTGVPMLRGQDRRLFARPGGGRRPDRSLPDFRLSLVFTPRNLQP